MDKLDFNQGTINFWIPKGKLDYGNNKFIMLYNYTDENGLIQIQKDKDNRLKVFYNYKGNGKGGINKNIHLDNNKRHMFTITWSLPDKKLMLYIDAKKEDEREIDTSPF